MGNKVFDTLLFRKMENLVATFVEDSKSIFYNGSQLTHPGEFGRYRENSIKDLLQQLTRYKVSDGFIITSKDHTSTQCDVVIYDNNDFPVLENNLIQFFSIESVIAIGEIKSTLNKTEFKKALIKLAKNKALAEDVKGNDSLKEKHDEYNFPISFLVCKNLSFDISKIDFDDIYGEIPRKYWHNVILLIEQGTITYNFHFINLQDSYKASLKENGFSTDSKILVETSRFTLDITYDCAPHLLPINSDDKFHHVKKFITALSQAIHRKNIFRTEIIYYIDDYDSDKILGRIHK